MSIFNGFSATTIIEVLIAIITGTVVIWKAVEFLWDKVRSHFDKHYHSKSEQNEILDKIAQQEESRVSSDHVIQELANNIKIWQKSIEEKMNEHEKKIDLLIESDKNDIRGYIVDKYHYFVEEKGYIDGFSLDVLQKRYDSYIKENGNSYVQLLMEEINKLPKHSTGD